MEVFKEITLKEFDAWSVAVQTKENIISENKAEDFELLIEELYPNGISETKLNDILWFEEDWIYEQLGMINEEQ